jgi:transcription initiation factor IIF auxiliary subunit
LKIFIDEPQAVLDEIEEVQNVLHPTFPDPERTMRNRDERFTLETSGGGKFTIAANVKFRDGHTETATHRPDLGRRLQS